MRATFRMAQGRKALKEPTLKDCRVHKETQIDTASDESEEAKNQPKSPGEGDLLPEYSNFQHNSRLNWPPKAFWRFEEIEGSLADAHKPVQDIRCGEQSSGLPGPLTPVASRELMGTAGRLPNATFDIAVYTLTYKDGPGDDVDQESMFQSLISLEVDLLERGFDRVAIPRIGCGKGQLRWGVVKRMVETAFCDTQIRVAAYGPAKPTPKETSTNTDSGHNQGEKWSEVVKKKRGPRRRKDSSSQEQEHPSEDLREARQPQPRRQRHGDAVLIKKGCTYARRKYRRRGRKGQVNKADQGR